MRLLRVEFLRLRSRRLVKIVLALLVVVVAATSVVVFATKSVAQGNAIDFRGDLEGFFITFGIFSAIGMFLVGASAAGAEWAAGTMQALLYWEPRRVRVMLAKVAALLVVATVLVLIVLGLIAAGVYVAANARGTTDGLTGGFWTSQLLLVVRMIGFAWFTAAAGFAIAFGTRNTGAALGAGFVYFISEQFLIAWKPWLARWSLTGNIVGWVTGGAEGPPNDDGTASRIYMGESGWTLLAYALIAIAVATFWMRQRDVT